MAASVIHGQCPIICFEALPALEAKEDLQPCQYLYPATHNFLKVCDSPATPQLRSETVPVAVFDGSSGSQVFFNLKSSDTIGKLQADYLKMRPELVGSLSLAYNGKPVQMDKTLGQLGVKPGAIFVTFQRCTGG